jgi:hypothetical protein
MKNISHFTAMTAADSGDTPDPPHCPLWASCRTLATGAIAARVDPLRTLTLLGSGRSLSFPMAFRHHPKFVSSKGLVNLGAAAHLVFRRIYPIQSDHIMRIGLA